MGSYVYVLGGGNRNRTRRANSELPDFRISMWSFDSDSIAGKSVSTGGETFLQLLQVRGG